MNTLISPEEGEALFADLLSRFLLARSTEHSVTLQFQAPASEEVYFSSGKEAFRTGLRLGETGLAELVAGKSWVGVDAEGAVLLRAQGAEGGRITLSASEIDLSAPTVAVGGQALSESVRAYAERYLRPSETLDMLLSTSTQIVLGEPVYEHGQWAVPLSDLLSPAYFWAEAPLLSRRKADIAEMETLLSRLGPSPATLP